MPWKSRIRSAALAAALVAVPLHARAEESNAELLQRLETLEHELALVKRKLEVKQDADDDKTSTAALVTADKQGYQITSPDKTSFKLRLRGYVQADSRTFVANQTTTSRETFALRRARLVFEGTLFENVDFRVMPDFAGSSVTLQDAYLNLRYFPLAQVQAGQFKAPFGLERLQSATALTFIERGFPTQIAPNRDLGVMLQGDYHEGRLSYQLAAMNGVTDGASATSDSDDAKDVVARVFAQPFIETPWAPLQGLGVGAAVTYGRQKRATTTYKTNGQDTFFKYATGVTERGSRLRIAPQASYSWGPFGALFEWTRSETDLVNALGAKLESDVTAWQIAASYVLTGESASFKGIVPRSPFRPGEGGWGAVELAARYHTLEVDGDVFAGGFASIAASARKASAWTVGANWTLNPFVKISLNYERTKFQGGGGVVGVDRPDEDLLLTRFQLAY